MNNKQIEHLASRTKHKPAYITHSKRNSVYRVLGFIENDIDGKWVTYIAYIDIMSNKVYSRTANNFSNFTKYGE